MKIKNIRHFILVCLMFVTSALYAKDYKVLSPDGRLTATM